MNNDGQTYGLSIDPRQVRAVIAVRALVVVVLTYATAVWIGSGQEGSGHTERVITSGLAAFAVTALALSLLFYLLLEFAGNLRLQVLVQMVLDVFLVTWLLWETGDATSPYFPLYILLIGVCGSLLGKNTTLFIAGFSVVCYTILSSIISQNVDYSFSGSEPPSRMVQIIAFNDVALLVVGLLAARLSERRKMREELERTTTSFEDLNLLHERILESVDSGLITTDLEGRIFGFNRAAEEIAGVSAGEIVGKSVFDLFGEEIRAPVRLCLEPAKEQGFTVEHFEAGIRRNGTSANGSRTAVICAPVPLKSRQGETYGMILSFQDITRMRVMEESLRRSDRLAALGRMAAGLAHEIRNPLGSVGSALQYLKDKVEPASREEEVLEVVLRESERLNKIIGDFLSYARPGEAELEYLDLRRPIEDTITLLELGPELGPGHSVEFAKPDEAVRVLADPERLKQVFWNLLRNSLEAMPDGGKILITVEELKGVHVRVMIEDEGIGMDSDRLEHLFEPFSEQTKGAGLGLPIVHKIVLDHGGRIDVFSRPGEGTRVIIELPQ
ncbi:MAG TPA: ATP-binding protein [Aridibacter sp.]|nr:ATP-binding protein [Aridibacter sp.]